MNRDKQFVVELQEDVSSGNLTVQLPPKILNECGWYEGTELEWVLDGDEVLLREATND